MKQATNIDELAIKAMALGSWVNGAKAGFSGDLTLDEQTFFDEISKERSQIVQQAISRCNTSPRFEQLWKHIGPDPNELLRLALKAAIFDMTEAGLIRLAKATDTLDFVTFEPEFVAKLSGSSPGAGQYDTTVSWYIPYIWNTSLDSRLALLRNPEVQVIAERIRSPWIEILEDVDGGVEPKG